MKKKKRLVVDYTTCDVPECENNLSVYGGTSMVHHSRCGHDVCSHHEATKFCSACHPFRTKSRRELSDGTIRYFLAGSYFIQRAKNSAGQWGYPYAAFSQVIFGGSNEIAKFIVGGCKFKECLNKLEELVRNKQKEIK